MTEMKQMVVKKMLKVEGEEIVVLRLYENKKRKMASQIMLMSIVCNSLIEESL